MKAINFLKSLLPTVGKDRIIEDCRLVRAEMKDHVEPAYHTAAELFKGYKFKSPELEKDFDVFARMIDQDRGDNIISTIHKNFKNIYENLSFVEKQVEQNFNEEMAAMGFTLQKATILQFIETVTFVTTYARKYLNYIYICETAQYPEGNTMVDESLTPAEIEWIHSNIVHFCKAFAAVTGKPATIEKQMLDIPDVILTDDNAKTMEATLGIHKVDPFQLGFIPVWMNPIYHIRIRVAEWQAERYKAAKEEARLLQLRKLNLEKVMSGKPDAAIQKEINYLEGRLQTILFKINKMEKDAQ